ncbi:hypothetical protein VTN31DRAFT_858 [Thermomyces dupontii]|uniref:uncharacterized protein n=1 Tax=Talaromyces thermophilus TaxID=28565 RepID=UPI003743667C
MIELSLARVSRLVQPSLLRWKAIHIAGTNGKGSIAAYISRLLTAGGVRWGRFTSPHLIDRWDCITVDEQVVREPLFRQVEDQVKHRDQRLGLGATEFEQLTATAFEVFDREQVDVGVVEVGLGGRLDATNILTNVLVSVIANIGLDHEAFLGNNLEAIASEKAGILKSGVPCVLDGTNDPVALRVLQARSAELKNNAAIAEPRMVGRQFPNLAQLWEQGDFEPHQKANMACAVLAVQKALAQIKPEKNVDDLVPVLSSVQWPGRLQHISLRDLVGYKQPALLDGAHNGQSAKVLGQYVDRKFRRTEQPVTWVISASRGKNLAELFGPLIRPGDSVGTVAFGPVDGMPWVQAVDPIQLAASVKSLSGVTHVRDFGGQLLMAMEWASAMANGGPMVIAGSLYLVSDVLRLLRDRSSGRYAEYE